MKKVVLITHANTNWDNNKFAKKGIEDLISAGLPVVELADADDTGKLRESYVKHNGEVYLSNSGTFSDSNVKDNELLKENNIYLLTGGFFTKCHKRTFNDLVRNSIKEDIEIILAGDAIFNYDKRSEEEQEPKSVPMSLSTNEEIINMIAENYFKNKDPSGITTLSQVRNSGVNKGDLYLLSINGKQYLIGNKHIFEAINKNCPLNRKIRHLKSLINPRIAQEYLIEEYAPEKHGDFKDIPIIGKRVNIKYFITAKEALN
ncbi:MAG: hypothetical protein JW791_04660 [Nanoarchaeota archaeon]|nr:hypothetical protein [Nanoarchaeota archaeon]